MILVVGATGDLGGLIARTLLDQGNPVRVLVRSRSRGDELVAAGAEAATGDLKDHASLRAACRGVDAVVTTATATARSGDDTIESVDRIGNRNLVDAAVAEGVHHFLFVSALGANPGHAMPLLRAKGETEQRLHHSGMAWTVLQPNLFMDKLPLAVVGGPALTGHPVTLVGEGRRRHSLVAMRDVTAYAIAALQRATTEGQTLVIGGPQPVSMRDVVTAFEHELGTHLPVRTVAVGEPVPGMPSLITELLAALETYDSPLDTSTLATTYGVTPTPLAAFVRDVVASSRQRVDSA